MHENNEEITIQNWSGLLSRQRWVISLVVLIALLASLITSLVMPPVYRAESTVLIRTGRGIKDYILNGSTTLGTYTPQNFVQVIQSRTLVQEVARSLGIDDNPNSKEFQRFQRAVIAYFLPGTDLMRVQLEWTNPRLASDAVNALVLALINHNQQMNHEAIQNAQAFLENRVAAAERELREAEEKYYNALKSTTEPYQEVSLVGGIPQLEVLLAKNMVALDAAKASLQQAAERFKKAGGNPAAAAAVLNSPQARQTRLELGELEKQYVAALEKYGEEAPTKVSSLVRQTESAKVALSSQLIRYAPRPKKTSKDLENNLRALAKWHGEVASLEARNYALTSLISQREKIYGRLSSQQAEMATLARNVRVAEQMYLLLKEKLEETQLAQAASFAEIQVLDPAVPPRYPVRPNLPLNLTVALVVGLLAGLAVASILDHQGSAVPVPSPSFPGGVKKTYPKLEPLTEEMAATEDNIRPALLVARRPSPSVFSTVLLVLVLGTVAGFLAAILFNYFQAIFGERFFLKLKQGIKILLGVR